MVNTPVEETEEKTTYSKEEVDAMIQREADRRVTQALKKQEQKNAEKVREAQKLSQREAAIAEKERQLILAENKNAASKVLADKGLDLSLVDFVLAEDAETMQANINLLDKAFKKSVKAEVEKRLASKAPQSTLDVNKSYTTKDFASMSLDEIKQVLSAE